ncbi:MAG: class I tRNA ligase family protein, partial [Thermomicrobiales bacterium]
LRNQGMILAAEGTKMSKSRGTQISPNPLVERYGADALRLHLMFLGPWEQGGPWNDRGITGMERFIRRAFQIVADTDTGSRVADGGSEAAAELRRLTHKTIARVSKDIEQFHFNTMIAALIEFSNELTKLKGTDVAKTEAWHEAVESLVLMMAPGTPYVAEEMWQMLGKPYSVHQQRWPVYDEALTAVDQIEIPVQINGKLRERVTIAVDATEDDAVAAAQVVGKIPEYLEGKIIRRTIYVPGRLINILVG